jgi:putative peptidoglycan lipid II flippase
VDPSTEGAPPVRRPGLVRSSGGISLLAGTGVVAGFLVDAAMAALFGAGARTDAFFIAATIPFSLAAVFLASANQALVPLLNSWFNEEELEVAVARSGGLLGAALVVGAAITVLGVALSPVLAWVIAPGSSEGTKELATRISVLLFLTVTTRVGAEVLRAVLNARFSFLAPAAMPIVENAAVLATMLALSPSMGVMAIPIGYVLGGFLQLTFMWAMVARSGLRLRPGWGFRDPAIRRGFRLLGLPIAGTGLNTLARATERFLVSFLAPGSITILNYAWVVVNSLGGTVFFRSVVVALLPRLSEAKRDLSLTRRTLYDGVRVMGLISVPLTGLTIVLASPLVAFAFQRGQFGADDSRALAVVLAVYALVFPLDALTRAMLSYFYARLDMATPFVNGFIGVSLTIVLAAALFWPLGVPGVALAYVLASTGNLIHAYASVRRRTDLQAGPILPFLLKVVIASSAGAAVAYGVLVALPDLMSFMGRGVRLGVPGLCGLFAVLMTLFLLRVRPGRIR